MDRDVLPVVAVMAVIILLCLSWLSGYSHGVSNTQRKAVLNGVAVYEHDKHGSPNFVWVVKHGAE